MRIKWCVLSLLLFLCMMMCFNTKFYAESNNENLFDDIISKTQGKVVEYGVTTSFMATGNGTINCNNILNDMGFKENSKIAESKSNNIYRIEFQKEKISGYVESVKEDDKSIIKISIIANESKNNIYELKNKVNESVRNHSGNAELFEYLKVKLPDSDIEHTNRTIVSLLESRGTIDIDTVRLQNGFSTICNTGKFKPTMINGKLIDFNFSVSNYTSGNYIIMGTPEILETY